MEKWMFYAILSMLFAGITSVLAKYGMKDLNSDIALLIRTGFVFLLILGNALIFKNIFAEIKGSPSSNYIYLGASAITTTLSWLFYYRAMKDGPVSFVASIDKASILITILLSYVFLKEPFSPKLFIGAGFVFLGLVVLIWK